VSSSHSVAGATLKQIDDLYGTRESSGLSSQPDLCAAIARRALSLGEPLLAYDLCLFGLAGAKDHAALRQLQGLALARSGAVDEAQRMLERLFSEGSRDEETLGLLARINKDRWLRSPDTDAGLGSLKKSEELYAMAYRSAGGYWAGINAATLARVLGKRAAARELAGRVADQCLAIDNSGQEVWRRATLGEASLLLGDKDQARLWYGRALEAGAGFGDRASMRKNARLVLGAQGGDPSWLQSVLPSPTIAVFSGHMIDAESRSKPRFPQRIETRVAKALREMLEGADIRIGYASAASGGDLLFHEALLDLGREAHVVLPEPPDVFAGRSVAHAHASWTRRFEQVLKHATSVVLHSSSTSGDIGYTFNNWIILGLARLRAKQLESEVRAFALWDGAPGSPGGTSTALRDWLSYGQAVEWLPPEEAADARWQSTASTEGSPAATETVGSQRIVSMLFADAVGFSKLPDESIPAFVRYFLGAVADVLAKQADPPLTRNTWGDGLYFCFASPRAAGLFALDLCDAIGAIRWADFGLPSQLSLRVALHCGPAHEVMDPVIRQRSYTGAQVSRAARIEPVTPAGTVYCSQTFAALCECTRISEFACEYVGRMPLAKKYGEYPMFCVRRNTSESRTRVQ
jgi:class 3 adenylate cyclase/tetratricopeptide (TPR) repeat protein